MAIGRLGEKEEIIIEPETGDPVIRVEPPQKQYEKKKVIVRRRQIIWYIWTVIEVILMMRFLLKFFDANSTNAFNILVNILSLPFVFLFLGLFPSDINPDNGVVIEWSTLFAIFVYAVIVSVISLFFRLRKPIDPNQAESES